MRNAAIGIAKSRKWMMGEDEKESEEAVREEIGKEGAAFVGAREE